jgi:hypothetical protein
MASDVHIRNLVSRRSGGMKPLEGKRKKSHLAENNRSRRPNGIKQTPVLEFLNNLWGLGTE